MPPRLRRSIPLSLLLLALAALPCAAQYGEGMHARLGGRIRAAETLAPVPGARVVLRPVALRAEALERSTTADGRFVFVRIEPGEYVLEVTHPDRGLATQHFTVGHGAWMDVELRMTRAVALDTLVATTRRRSARDVRLRTTPVRPGMLMTRGEIETMRGTVRTAMDMVRRMPHIRVRPMPTGGPARSVCIESETATRPLRGGGCYSVEVYLDGAWVPEGGDLLAHLPADQVESLEFVSGGQAGSRFGTGSAPGVLLVFTRGNGPYAEPADEGRLR